MAFEANIEQFSGPLDLMLHLIRENKLDIFDLDVVVLCDQYLEYLEKMQDLKLEIESEYLVELATLIEYKSKKLLPKNSAELEDDYKEDPKDALVKRLIEYQKYKEVSLKFQEAYSERLEQMAKPLSDVDNFRDDTDDVLYDGNSYELLKAMNRILRRLKLSRPVETKLAKKEISVDDRILVIKARLKDMNESFDFDVLIDDCHDLQGVVVTFLAVLDLIKDSLLNFKIGEDDHIYLKRSVN